MPISNETFNVFIDGELVIVANYNFSDTSIKVGEVTTLYVANSEILTGDHTIRLVGPQAINDEFVFTI